jgi:hypothetical protein
MLIFAALAGCEDKFEEVTPSILKIKWEKSLMHSSVSWWYVAKDDTYHYLVEKYPLKSNGYKVKVDLLKINANPRSTVSSNTDTWVNLKQGDIQF